MSFSGRLLVQNCESAELALNWDQVRSGDEKEIQKCQIGTGLVVFVCFRDSANDETITKMTKAILTTKILHKEDGQAG